MINLSLLRPSVVIVKPKILIYGKGKIGKSTFASQAPSPVVMDLEGGMNSINIAKHKVNSFQQALEFCRALLSQQHDFETLIVDSADWLERIMGEQLCRENGTNTLIEGALKFGNGERSLLKMWNQLIAAFDLLQQERNMGIILIAHPQIKKFEDPMAESYDQYSVKLEKKCGDRIKEWVDCILFASMKVKIEDEKKNFGGVIHRGKDLGRVLYTEGRPSFEAGNRYNLPPEIPFSPQNSWQTFYSHIDKFHKNIAKNVVKISQDQVGEIRELIDLTGASEEIFLNWLVNSRGAKPMGELKIENFPADCFELMKEGLEKKKNAIEAKGMEVNHESSI